MNNKQAIIDKIISDANIKAEENLSVAQLKQDEILNSAKQEVDKIFDANKGKDNIVEQDVLSRKKVIAKLDVKKIILAQKKAVVAEAFQLSLKQLSQSKDYLEIVQKMISLNAEDGDLVSIAEHDKDKITATFIAKVAKACGKKIQLSKQYADISGGVILVGNKCDKNISLDFEFSDLKEKIENDVVDIMFGENANG